MASGQWTRDMGRHMTVQDVQSIISLKAFEFSINFEEEYAQISLSCEAPSIFFLGTKSNK